jgi:glycosyltransferase involved in cell wall biosynthesis
MLKSATLTGIASARYFRPETNYLAGGLSRRLVEVDRHYDDSEIIWQEEVYQFARQLANSFQPARIVDIGTGTGIKLHTAFQGHPAIPLQVDWKDERDPLPDGAPQGAFLATNLEDFQDLEALEAALDPREPTLFILSDVIEHLQDPRPVLRTLRRLLKRHPQNRLVISTPDRHRVDGARAEGMPDNVGHVRQWTLNEFGLAMLSCGFQVRRIGRLPQHKFDRNDRNICCELACSAESHRHWLWEQGLPPPSDHLVLTTEHARADRTGGIGTYLQLAEQADGLPRLVVFAGAMGLPEANWSGTARSRGWIHVADMCGRGNRPLAEVAQIDTDEILRAVIHTLFLYDDVRLIEYQDYLGIGHRVAQAKRVNLLPPSVTVMAYVHGNHVYLDAAGGRVTPDRPLGQDARERLSVELADVVAFPSRYIRNLYVEAAGFRVRAEKHLPYPILLRESGMDDLTRGAVRNLVFYGKQTAQKGYFDFVQAVLELFSNPAYAEAAGRVQRVVLMGVTDPDPRLAALGITIEHGVWSRSKAVDMLRAFAADSLVVLPYRGDNHPLSVFEVVDFDCELLAFDIGGVPELLPPELHEMVLCAPNPGALAAAMARTLDMKHYDRCRLVERTRVLLRESYLQHIENYKATIAQLKRGSGRRMRPAEPGAVTVVVPNLNGTEGLLADVAVGLRNSFHRPAKVVLVDDGSTPEGLAVLRNSAAAFGDIPTEVVVNPANLGLAGARNSGLAVTETPYLCPHDNDNIVLNRFLQIACRVLDENPEVAAVTTWSRFFEDGKPWQAERWGAGYRPIGADFGLALRTNAFGDALAVYRVSVLQEMGGWNASSKAKWEDWELFLRLTAAGKDIWIIPSEQVLYRVRPDSMLRTYQDFPAWLRLANALPGLPKAQAISALRSLWIPSIEHHGELAPVGPRMSWLDHELGRVRDWAEDAQRRLDSVWISKQEAEAHRDDLQIRLDRLWAEKLDLEARLGALHGHLASGDGGGTDAVRADLQYRLDQLWAEKVGLEQQRDELIRQISASPDGAAMLQIASAGSANMEALLADQARLRAIEASTTWRVTYRVRHFFEQRPQLKAVVRAPLALCWRAARAVKQAIRRA